MTSGNNESYTSSGTNLSDASAGAKVLFATDEFFAVADNLLSPKPPTFDPNAYCEHGKVMDGWESRRRRDPGHDWCIIKLAYPGTILGVELDTAFFTGNHAPRVSIQAAQINFPLEDSLPGAKDRIQRGGGIQGSNATSHEIETAEQVCNSAVLSKSMGWSDVLPMTPMKPGYPGTRLHRFTIPESTSRKIGRVTHLRVNYFPDGGVARLKIWGEVIRDFERDIQGKYLDLAAAAMGGKGLACSNKHFGVPSNLIKPGRGVDMSDGWETARHPNRPPILRRDPNTGLVDTELMDWCILKLGAVLGQVEKLVLDTAHFKGNFPESVTVEGCYQPNSSNDFVCKSPGKDTSVGWFPLLKRTKLGPHMEHTFELAKGDLCRDGGSSKGVSHLRLSIFPDGGLSRVKVFGRGKERMGGMSNNLNSKL
mmetsp:Transcript_53249/g.79086  ORF Transcript_53249/g.79086 Transcript_53249/m.79086 type:complete len:423 (-) Transcript_53249:35-1303(-)|eukprot:CAMPEP_0195520180 /NCGR_PEP_ID=MMETSP0794_2-20130614/16336_1 /TAXON_ID=515487 /ORGANISM="Stephanopyxis turris, Strain CCMP 815" /LENGTH=422 /DNA_ID=CAMNT_0040649477 /DNA_START=142 /DNA_END=1410 /DNA_ORIENTATION=+